MRTSFVSLAVALSLAWLSQPVFAFSAAPASAPGQEKRPVLMSASLSPTCDVKPFVTKMLIVAPGHSARTACVAEFDMGVVNSGYDPHTRLARPMTISAADETTVDRLFEAPSGSVMSARANALGQVLLIEGLKIRQQS